MINHAYILLNRMQAKMSDPRLRLASDLLSPWAPFPMPPFKPLSHSVFISGPKSLVGEFGLILRLSQ
jgi:hypothetical protein